MWYSQTYGKLNIEDIPNILNEFYNKHKKSSDNIEITIGTDSQNIKEGTRIVTVVSIIAEGKGGIFFYNREIINRIDSVKVKLEEETNRSIIATQSLISFLENNSILQEMYINVPVSIHIDAGNSIKGKTRDLVQGLTGWVHGMGYDCKIKPDSYSASCIADKLSK